MSNYLRGFLAAVFCFTFWGMAPIYWKQFAGISVLELLCHRIVWGLLLLGSYIFVKKKVYLLIEIFSNIEKMRLLLASAIVIGINWYTFSYAILENHILEASLGYFINPLMNVVMGVVFLGEKLNRTKWLSLGLAALGVAVLFYGKVSGVSISLILATTFALYGLIRKQLIVETEIGLFVELLILFGPALFIFAYYSQQGVFQFFEASHAVRFGLFSCGLITVVPLFIFVFAAKRLALSQLGMIQYLAPTLQLLVGYSLYNEAFTSAHFISFGLIWMGIIIFLHRDLIRLFKGTKYV